MATAAAQQLPPPAAVAAHTVWEPVAVVGLIALAAALRFTGLGAQSFWFDETVTASILHQSLSGVLHAVPRSESTPPLYYVLAWGWTRLFGVHEAGLRSFSALVGTATVPVAWLAGRRLMSARAGVFAAALVAVNPMLVWYSQEARAYGLAALLGAASFAAFVHVRQTQSRRALAAWAVFSALALCTHYFAAFLVVGEALALLFAAGPARRAVLAAIAGVGAVGIALIPLAHRQEADGRTAWIAAMHLGDRVREVLQEIASVNVSAISSGSAKPGGALGAIAIALVISALGLALTAARGRARRAIAVGAAVAALAVVIPLLLALTPLDYFKDRNLIAAWPALLVALGAGLALARPRTTAVCVLVALCAAGVVTDIRVARDPSLQRSDWRGLARLLGPPRQARVLVVQPTYATGALALYGHPTTGVLPGARVAEVDVVGAVDPAAVLTAAPGFRPVERRTVHTLSLTRYRSAEPQALTAAAMSRSHLSLVLEPSLRGQRWITDFIRQVLAWRSALEAIRAHHVAPAEALGGTISAPADIARRFGTLPSELPNIEQVYLRLRGAAAAARELQRANPPTGAQIAAFDAAVKRIG